MKTNRQPIAILILVISLVGLSCISESATSTPSPIAPTATPDPDLIGRLLWLAKGKDNAPAVYEFSVETMTQKTLVESVPHKPGIDWIGGVFSEDGKFLMVYDEDPANVVIVDVLTGVIKPVSLPGITRLAYGSVWGSFSPDNNYLVYALTGKEGISKSGLYLLNLASGETATLYEPSCSDYLMGGEVCGAVYDPNWIDDATLIFNAYKGEMPETINVIKSTTHPYGVPQIPPPNRTFVITLDGAIIQEFEPVFGHLDVQGITLIVGKYSGGLYYAGDVEEVLLFETTDIKHGVVKPKPFKFSIGSALSPDGNYALNSINDQWHLIDLRSGSDQIVENVERNCGVGSYPWSPSGKYIVCNGVMGTQYLRIVSLAGLPDHELPLSIHFISQPFIWVP
jgi:hypothetical protein